MLLYDSISRYTLYNLYGTGYSFCFYFCPFLKGQREGNTCPQLSQLAEPLWTDPGLKTVTGAHKLISTFEKKKKKKAQVGNDVSNLSKKNSLYVRKMPPEGRRGGCGTEGEYLISLSCV